MFFSKFSIKNKIISVSAIMIATMIGIIGIAYKGLMKSGDIMQTFYNVQYVNTKNQMELRRDIQTINKRVLVGVISKDKKVVDEQVQDFDSRFAKMDNIMNDMEKSLGEPEKVQELKNKFALLKEEAYNLMDLAKDGKNNKALNEYNNTFNKVISENLADALSEVGDISDTQAEGKYAENVSLRQKSLVGLVIVMAIGLSIITVAFSFLIKSITKPISEIEDASNKMQNGDFDINIEHESSDELGKLADGFRMMSSNTRKVVEDANLLLSRMADREFNVESNCEERYVGEYEKLISAIYQVRDNITDALKEVTASSEQVTIDSEQVSSIAQYLSQGSTEQASAVEELSTTIDQIDNQTKSNVENAINTSKIVNEAGDNLNKADISMKELMLAIQDINMKANQISEIIKTIDDIAFQTNILSLNAAVEAARAGESGKGFAVVADEVRNLAGKSAEAAKNIEALINSTISSIENGTLLASKTEQNLTTTVVASEKAVSVVNEIVNSSEQQANSISQVKTGIEQISEVVQNNSATSEEVAATSETLANQAGIMKKLVEQFTLGNF